MAAQVTADKATVADNAAKVAEDRTAAETAAQTAQAVADSLPDDYTTAVGKIAENTAEISAVKLTDKELTRRVDALYDMGQGITHKFETDSETAYQKTVPTGAKLMSVKSVGGRSIVWNQLVDFSNSKEITAKGVKFTFPGDGIVALNGTCTEEGQAIAIVVSTNVKGHKYLLRANPLSGVYGVKQLLFSSQGYGDDQTGRGVIITNGSSNAKWYYTLYVYKDVTYDNVKIQPQFFDLTQMFGTGNEPTSVEEFEKMFPADYYPYNEGEIVNAGTEEVVEQGKNLFDYTNEIYHGQNVSKIEKGIIYTKGLTSTALNIPTVIGKEYTLSFKAKSNTTNQGGLRWSLQKGENTSYAHDSPLIKSEVGYEANTEYQALVSFVADTDFVSLCTIVNMIYDVQLEEIDTPTTYAPYYQTAHPIPKAIRNLPGYGWSAETARNYIDYENKRYVQSVGSVDLGTVTWRLDYNNWWYNIEIPKGLSDSNALCSKRTYVIKKEAGDETQWCHSGSGYFEVYVTDATTPADVAKKMSGVILYYELATPITTDISDLIDDDFLRNIEVEAGGSITFKNGNDSYRIPVPSEEEYVVKLSEVGGTT